MALVKPFKLLGHLSNLCPQSLHPAWFSEVQKDQVLERTSVLAQWPQPLLVLRGGDKMMYCPATDFCSTALDDVAGVPEWIAQTGKGNLACGILGWLLWKREFGKFRIIPQ